MALNTELQKVVNDLKDAKTTIASALSNIDGIDANSGLGTIAEQVDGKTSIYDTSDASPRNSWNALTGTTFYDQSGKFSGAMTNQGLLQQILEQVVVIPFPQDIIMEAEKLLGPL